jgi:hypothetical protein
MFMTKTDKEELHSGEDIKMSKDKEQLEDAPEAPVEEEKKEEETASEESEKEETLKEEPKEEPKKEEKLEEEPAEEEKPAEEEEKPAEEAESLSETKEEIKKTKEELAVVKEVRDELVALYANFNDIKASKEQLEKELETLKTDNTKLSEQLSRYQKAEEQLKAKERQERIEKLSEKFKLLGQEKTVEQLSEKDEETLSEFEAIVSAALDKTGETKEMPNVTAPSQGKEQLEETKETEEIKTEESVEKLETVTKKETLSNNNFFKNICDEMTRDQLEPTRGSKVRVM